MSDKDLPIYERRANEHWHIDKKIPITIIFTFIIQTATAGYYLAKFESKLENLNNEIKDLKTEKYTKNDALKDINYLNLKIENVEKRLELELAKRK